jgi:prepilin-type N-terminal cleavage/methylation domain-containing protein/prepilin-type processing-associated H-X9-DG protein
MFRKDGRLAIRHRAFTLVEILVVIAIIAVILAIVLPVFLRVREKGRAMTCLNNLSQLGKAFQMYMQDYDGYLPRAFNVLSAGRGMWVALSPPCTFALRLGECHYMPEQGVLYPYVRNRAIYVCPSDPYGIQTHLSYGMNVNLGADVLVVHESEIIKPSQTVLLVEQPYDEVFHCPGFRGAYVNSPDDITLPCHTDGRRCVNLPTGTQCFKPVACYHNYTSNVLFVDGNVKIFPKDKLKVGFFKTNQ